MPTRTGTATQVDASGAESSSTSVTVPADATMAVAFWSLWDGAGGGLTSLAVGANTFTVRAEVNIVGGATGAGVASLHTLPGTGSQTFAWVWDGGIGAPDEGGWIALVWVKDHNTTTPVRDADVVAAESTTGVQATVDTETTDLVLAACQKFNSGLPPVLDGTVFIDDSVVNSERYDVSEVTAGTPTTTVTMTQEDYSSIMAISLPATAGGAEKQSFYAFRRRTVTR